MYKSDDFDTIEGIINSALSVANYLLWFYRTRNPEVHELIDKAMCNLVDVKTLLREAKKKAGNLIP